MKKNILFAFVLVSLSEILFSQVPLKKDEYTKTEKGFIYYLNVFKDRITFVPVAPNSKNHGFSNFTSKQLGMGYQLASTQIILDSLDKFGISHRLDNFWSDTIVLTIVPVTLTYSVGKYSMSKEQMKARTVIEKFRFGNNFVLTRSTAGLPIRIISCSPPLYFFNSPE